MGAIVILALSAACSSPALRDAPANLPAASHARRVLLNVPFYTDDTDQCGPSALDSVLGYWGKASDPARLGEEVYLKHLKGSLPVDLILAAQSRGMQVRMLEGSLPKLKRELRDGHPLIAFMNVGFRFFPVWHYVVLTGYDDQQGEMLMHTGTRKNTALPYGRFMEEWSNAEKWALVILPRKRR